jgi:hypothetical protein
MMTPISTRSSITPPQSDVDDDFADSTTVTEKDGDYAAVARRLSADATKTGFNMLTQVNLWTKGAAQLAKDNVCKKRVGGRRRIARKLRLNRAISARMAVISASTIESTGVYG